MLLAILLVVIFFGGLNVLMIAGAISMIKDEIKKAVKEINYNTNNGIEQSTTAIFNMESIKETVERKGKFEV